MTLTETLFAQPIFQALGWALIHFIWQGALIAVLYFALRAMLKRQSSNVRYTVACAALALSWALKLTVLPN